MVKFPDEFLRCGQNVFRVLMTYARKTSRSKGWTNVEPADWNIPYIIPAKLSLIHSEVTEALEEYRVGNQDRFLTELADVVIRVFDLAGAWSPNPNLFNIIMDKLEANTRRPYRHGGKRQ